MNVEDEVKQLRSEVKQLKELVMSLMQRVIPDVADDECEQELQEPLPPGTIHIPTYVGLLN